MITHTIITMATSIAIAIPTVAPITALVVLVVSLVTVDILDVVDVTNTVVVAVVDGTADVKVCCTDVKDIRLVGNNEADSDIVNPMKDVTSVLILILIEDGLVATEI